MNDKISNTQQFISKEAIGGLLLMAATVIALIANNSSLSPFYHYFLNTPFSIQIGQFSLSKPILLWINDGLMTVFFFLVGLELKRECLVGHLNQLSNVLQPVAAALGGMVVPVLLYLLLTHKYPDYQTGWAIPMATDIAFALGILCLFDKFMPKEVKIFLLTLAIIDDIGAIMVIAAFHSQNLSVISLIFSVSFLLILVIFNNINLTHLTPYFIIGVLLWLSVLKSGIHATLSGILFAFTIPFKDKDNTPIIEPLEHSIHDFVAYFVLPLFAFANAGVSLQGLHWNSIIHPLSLAIIIGLLVGKPLGVFSFSWISEKLFKIKLTITWLQLLIVGLLAGIGFTMSLFIAVLSFNDNHELLNLSRLGILLGSLAAMTVGIFAMLTQIRKLDYAQNT